MKLGPAVPAAALAANMALPAPTAVTTGYGNYGPTLVSSLSALSTSASSLSSLLSKYNAQGGPSNLQQSLLTAQYAFETGLSNADSAASAALTGGISNSDASSAVTQFANLVTTEKAILRTLVYAYNYFTADGIAATALSYLSLDSTSASILASDLEVIAPSDLLSYVSVLSSQQSSAFSQAISAFNN